MTALVIHARRTGYGVVRTLFDLNFKILIADEIETPIYHSNKIFKSYILPPIISTESDLYLKRLLDIGKENYTDYPIVVFTGKDDYLLFFAEHYPELKQYFIFSFESDYQKLKNVLGKKSLYELALKANVLSPTTITDEDDKASFEDLIYPVVVKPDFKNTPDQNIAEKIFRIRKCFDLNQLLEAISVLDEVQMGYVIQEFIPGSDDKLYTLGIYAYKGDLLAYSMAKKIRQFPIETGECSFGVTINDDSLIEPTKRLIKNSNISGICQIEFKKHEDKFYLIEINPRVWSWHELHKMVGVDLVRICINKIFFKKDFTLIVPNTNTNKSWHFSSMDLLHNVLLNKKISLYQWLVALFKADIHAFYTKDDLKPVMHHWRKTLKYIYTQLKKVS